MTARELSQFQLDIIRDHSGAARDGNNFTVYWDTHDPTYNCFAYCINKTTRRITPTNIDILDEQCVLWLI